MSIVTTTPPRGRVADLRRALLVVVAALAVIVPTVTLGATPASALSGSMAVGTYGGANIPVAYVQESAMYRGVFQMYVPGVTLQRTSAVGLYTNQTVGVTYVLEVWTTSGWQTAEYRTRYGTIASGQRSVGFAQEVFQPGDQRGGFYRITYLFTWANGSATAQVAWTTSQTSEFQCRSIRSIACAPNLGYVKVK